MGNEETKGNEIKGKIQSIFYNFYGTNISDTHLEYYASNPEALRRLMEEELAYARARCEMAKKYIEDLNELMSRDEKGE